MLTSNTELLRRLDALEKQWQAAQGEIDLRIKQCRADDEGYVIVEEKSGKYSLVSGEFFAENLLNTVKEANKKLSQCKCKE